MPKIKISLTEYDTVAGSRRSIKDPHNPAQKHYYGESGGGDIWTDYLEAIAQAIPKGYIVYGEIIGWTKDGAPIQKGHTYDMEQGEHALFVYRVATINPDGALADLSWDQVRTFCLARGIDVVPELWRGPKRDFELESFVEKDFAAEHRAHPGLYRDVPVLLSAGGTGKDEGIAIRVDQGNPIPALYKYKNESHYLYETAALDAGELDLEASES